MLTSRNSHTFHQSHIWFPQFIRPRPPASASQRPCSGSGLTQAQSFLGEAQLGSLVPPKTDSIHSWPLQPPLRPGGPTELKAPSLPLPSSATWPARSKPAVTAYHASPMTDTSFVMATCSPMQSTSQPPPYPRPGTHSTFSSPTSSSLV